MKQTLNHLTPKQKIARHRRVIISTLVGAGLSFGLMGNANAHCVWYHPGHCIEDVANDVVDTVEDTANDVADTVEDTANDVADTVEDTANDVADFTETTVNDVSDTATDVANEIEDGLEDVATAIEDAVMSVYSEGARLMYQQVGEPMNNMVDAWKTLINSEPGKYQRLVNAIRTENGSETKAALEDVLVSLYTYAGFAGIVQDFKDKNAGSLLFIASVGGGVGITLEGDIGLAIDIDYLVHFANRVANGYDSSKYRGAIGSLFTAVGMQIGPAAGGGADLVVGYHLADPDGVYGPGLDISLEIKAKLGGGIGFSYDVSQVPWQIVMGGISIGAGVEVQLSIGPSYTFVLGQLCSNGRLKEFANQCKRGR